MKIKVVTKNTSCRLGEYEESGEFVFTTDEACSDYDWLVVFDDFNGEIDLKCPKERTIFATWEPTSIKNYSKVFTRQFGHLLTNRPPEAEKHPHYHFCVGYFPWKNGRTLAENKVAIIPEKKKVMSVVCTAKAMRWTKHYNRMQLVKRLVEEIPGTDWFGWGVREIDKKFEALDEYRYHVAFENHIAPGFWTEKIVEAFLSECLPFYAGDPEIAKAFPEESFIAIPPDDPDEAIRIIRDAIARDEWSKRIDAIREAKARCLSRYNFFAQVIELINREREQEVSSIAREQKIHSRHYFRLHSLSANIEDGFFHLKQYLRPFLKI